MRTDFFQNDGHHAGVSSAAHVLRRNPEMPSDPVAFTMLMQKVTGPHGNHTQALHPAQLDNLPLKFPYVQSHIQKGILHIWIRRKGLYSQTSVYDKLG